MGFVYPKATTTTATHPVTAPEVGDCAMTITTAPRRSGRPPHVLARLRARSILGCRPLHHDAHPHWAAGLPSAAGPAAGDALPSASPSRRVRERSFACRAACGFAACATTARPSIAASRNSPKRTISAWANGANASGSPRHSPSACPSSARARAGSAVRGSAGRRSNPSGVADRCPITHSPHGRTPAMPSSPFDEQCPAGATDALDGEAGAPRSPSTTRAATSPGVA
jgi:hypothetical protein